MVSLPVTARWGYIYIGVQTVWLSVKKLRGALNVAVHQERCTLGHRERLDAAARTLNEPSTPRGEVSLLYDLCPEGHFVGGTGWSSWVHPVVAGLDCVAGSFNAACGRKRHISEATTVAAHQRHSNAEVHLIRGDFVALALAAHTQAQRPGSRSPGGGWQGGGRPGWRC